MTNCKKSMRLNISMSPQMFERGRRIADEKFAGNFSAYIACCMLMAEKCSGCGLMVGRARRNNSLCPGLSGIEGQGEAPGERDA